MPLNLIKRYPQLLELSHLSEHARNLSLRGIYDRDHQSAPTPVFRLRAIRPLKGIDTPPDIDIVFRHLITEEVPLPTGGRKREFDIHRSQRLHWIRFHLDERRPDLINVFSAEDWKDGKRRVRTYILDSAERYVVILEPFRKQPDYYLVTAFFLEPRNLKKMKQRAKRKLPDVL